MSHIIMGIRGSNWHGTMREEYSSLANLFLLRAGLSEMVGKKVYMELTTLHLGSSRRAMKTSYIMHHFVQIILVA